MPGGSRSERKRAEKEKEKEKVSAETKKKTVSEKVSDVTEAAAEDTSHTEAIKVQKNMMSSPSSQT